VQDAHGARRVVALALRSREFPWQMLHYIAPADNESGVR